jgi:type IV secretion system protein VirB6
MGIVTSVMQYTDTTLVNYAQDVFTGIAAPMRTLLTTVGTLSLIIVAINNVYQFAALNIASYIHWMLRFVLVFAFATVWLNFSVIYDVLINVPTEYISVLLNAANIAADGTKVDNAGGVYQSIDDFGNTILNIASDLFGKVKVFKPKTWINLILGAVVFVMGLIFLAAAVVIVLVSKAGFAVAIGLAPLAIAFLLFPQTSGYFQSWLNFTVGFLVVPILTASLMALLLVVSGNLADIPSDKLFGGKVGLVMLLLAALVLLFQIPTMASSLAQTSVAAVGAGAAFASARMMGGALSKPLSAVSAAKNFSYAHGQARLAGQSRIASIGSALGAMRVGSQVRQQRLYNTIPALRGPAGNSQKALAAPSGSSTTGGSSAKPLSEEMRNQMKK